MELDARVLGAFRLTVDGRSVDRDAFERPSGLRLVKLLLATPGHRVRREAAAELLWPEADPERSGVNLRKALHFARRAFDHAAGGSGSAIVGDGEVIRIEAESVTVDADELRQTIATVLDPAHRRRDPDGGPASTGDLELLDRLVELTADELLEEDAYDEWIVPLRERLRHGALEALAAGAGAARAQGRTELAHRLVDRILDLEPADEAAHRLAIELHIGAGHLHAARRQLLACGRALAEAYGVSAPPELVELVERAAATRPAVLSQAAEAPIVGRRLELEAAEPALDSVSAGTLGAVVYRGMPGIGKTRILREIVGSSSAAGWSVCLVRGLESAPDLAFGALGSALATMLRGAVPDAVREPGRSALLTIAPSLPGSPTIDFANDRALSAALLDALRALASERPLVLAMDDVQWLDASTVGLLNGALVACTASPLLVVATVRDEPDILSPGTARFIADAQRAGAAVVRVGPMPPRDLTVLLERTLGGRVDAALADAIAVASHGTPLFAIEVAREARDVGAIAEHRGRWAAARTGVPLPVPSEVRRLVEHRTRSLPAGVVEVLRTAAEIGDEFDLQPLIAAGADGADDPAAVLDALDEGITAGLIIERGGRYAFAHPLFRAALRSGLRRKEAAEIHARVARALAGGQEPTGSDAGAAAVETSLDPIAVAEHSARAVELGHHELLPLAVAFGLAAGDRMAAVLDHRRAIATIERTIDLWRRLPEAERPRYPVARAYLHLGWAHHALGDEVAAARSFRDAAACAADDRERAQAWQAAAWMPYQHGEFRVADELLRRAEDTLADPTARAALASERAWIKGRSGDWAGAYRDLVAIMPALEQESGPLLARALDRMGVARASSGDPFGSLAVHERGLRLAREIGETRLEATMEMHLADALRALGRCAEARHHIQATLSACAMTGDRYIEAVALWVAAEIEHADGRLAEAVDLRHREIEALSSIGGNDQNRALAHAHLARLGSELGDVEMASREAELARAVARDSHLHHLSSLVERTLANRRAGIDAGNAAGTIEADPPDRER